jgi:lysophospholipase L1-like esterase
MTDSSFTKPEARPLTILCFGDSLTEGYSQFGMIMTPYSKTLKAKLTLKLWAWKGQTEVVVVTDGQSGDLITTGSFKARMNENCALPSVCLVERSERTVCGSQWDWSGRFVQAAV